MPDKKNFEKISRRISNEVEKLPPAPSTIFEIRKAVANPNVEFHSITPFIEKDPALTADLLKFANSARYSVGHKVDTINEALMYFGMSNLVDYISTMFAMGAVTRLYSKIKGVEHYLAHSREVAGACKILAQQASCSQHDQDTLALVGLLHDIGKLVLTVAADQEGIPMLGINPEHMSKSIESEQELWGIDHCQVGVMICRKWDFPEIFAEGIQHHHSRPDVEHFSKPGVMILLAHVLSIRNLPDTTIKAAFPPAVLEKMNLNAVKLRQAEAAISKHLKR